MRLAVLQGRLSLPPSGRPQAFPKATWRDEFTAARRCGYDALEWLVTADGLEDNPLWTAAGCGEIRAVADAAGVPVLSVCADCFIDRPVIGVTVADRAERMAILIRLLEHAWYVGARVVLLPLLEGNACVTADDGQELLHWIAPALSRAASLDLTVAIESDWPGDRLRDLVAGAGTETLGVYYDTGNAVTYGLDPIHDLHVLGPWVRGVHLKDRRRDGPSVPLGEGDADLAGALAALAGLGYAGPIVLETPAGEHPMASARANLAVARRYLSQVTGARP